MPTITWLKVMIAVLLGAVLVSGAAIAATPRGHQGWVVYSGREGGLRIVFELNGHRLTRAYVSIPVACTNGDRGRRHFVEYENRNFAIRVHRDGTFHDTSERIETYGSEFQDMIGRVTPKKIEGTLSLSFSERARVGNEECYSGRHAHGPAEVLSFRANRHSAKS